MRIALLGTRGVPAAYGGFETLVEHVGAGLAERGHEVIVYCRPGMTGKRAANYRGMRLVFLPTIRTKHLDTIVHTLLSTLHMSMLARADVALYFIAGNAPLAALCRILGIPSIINVDGLDSRRVKWGRFARIYLQWAERNAPRCATSTITDSREIQRHYRDEFGYESQFIPYGADMQGESTGEHLRRYGLEPRGYLLFVGRLVEENNAHVLLKAYEGLDTEMKLVIVGDAPYADEYKESLMSTRDNRVVFTGYVFGAGYKELCKNAALFVSPTDVGSTHPVIVEAMAAGNCVVVNDYPPNVETIGNAGVSYDGSGGPEALRRVLADLLRSPEVVACYRERAAIRAREVYSWDVITDAYEGLSKAVVEDHRRRE